MLSIRNVTYTKCYLYEMLPIQIVRYEMLPRRNVTIRKCTIRNVTDPFSLISNTEIYVNRVVFIDHQLRDLLLSRVVFIDH